MPVVKVNYFPPGFPDVFTFYSFPLLCVLKKCPPRVLGVCWVLMMSLSLPCDHCRSNLPNYSHSSSSAWPVSVCPHTGETPGSAPLVITPREAEKMHARAMTAANTSSVTSGFNGRLSNLISRSDH